ncbi:hypothetical protein GF336_00810 [Candidatus Woesearchaeota archaeon]|nr:hypothetical protein [Candidatus Woesearchaeota archaeon]
MKKALAVVAHPDDETIWMGGTILKNKRWDWTIVSLCRKGDLDRAPKFKKVCRILGAKSFISDLDDEKMMDIPSDEIKKRLRKFAGSYDCVFTHGKNGEYGHKRHVDVHDAVVEMVEHDELNCSKLIFFSYVKNGKYCYPSRNSDRFIKLDGNVLDKKKKLIEGVYGFDKKSFESICCRAVESFKL